MKNEEFRMKDLQYAWDAQTLWQLISRDKGPVFTPAGLIRWMKFNLVGAIGIGVQLAALALLTHVWRWNYLPATALAVEAAVLHNFFWHERFTWADRGSSNLRQCAARLARFNVTTGAISIAGNLVFMRLLVTGIGVPPVAANLASIALCSLFNFVVNDRVVFRKQALSIQPSAISESPHHTGDKGCRGAQQKAQTEKSPIPLSSQAQRGICC